MACRRPAWQNAIMFERGDQVEILPEFRDKGDDAFTWVVLSDEDKGRVDISPIDINMAIKPTYTVRMEWIRKVKPQALR
jgi:hypothetical protein